MPHLRRPNEKREPDHVTSRKEDIRPEFQDRCFPGAVPLYIYHSIQLYINIHFPLFINSIVIRGYLMCPQYRRERLQDLNVNSGRGNLVMWPSGRKTSSRGSKTGDLERWVPLPNVFLPKVYSPSSWFYKSGLHQKKPNELNPKQTDSSQINQSKQANQTSQYV